MNRYLGITLGTVLVGLTTLTGAFGQSATLLPNAVQTFVDNNGKPLANGNVFFYVPSTTTPKITWVGSNESGTAQPNPVPLGISGRPASPIYGDGIYRQIVQDQFNNVIWDALTASTGGGSGPGPTVGDGNIVGTILPWAGLVAPPNYVFAYGQAISRANYPLYTSTVTITTNLICTSGLNVLSGIADTSQIRIGAPVEATCIPPGTTVTAVASNSVTVRANASISTATSAQFFPYGNGDGSTTLNVPDFRGRTLAGRDNMGGTSAGTLTQTYYGANTSPDALGSAGGSQSSNFALVLANLPPYTPAGTITNGAITVSAVNGLVTGSAISTGGGSVSPGGIIPTATQANSTFLGTAQGGTSTPVVTSLVQPTVTMNYVIKVLPDTSTTVATGVAALGGMTGVIACGTGLTCGSQTIQLGAITGFLPLAAAPVFPLVHPSSTNLACAQGHFLAWMDENLCSTADTFVGNSSDPSALLQFTPSGTVTGSRLQTLTFIFGSGICATSNPACAATYTTASSGDTLSTVTTALVASILANPNLYNNVSLSQGQVQTATKFQTSSISIDFNANVPMKVTATDAGSTISYNLPGACATVCSNSLDVNWTDVRGRNSGGAPSPNSEIYGLVVQGTNSTSPATYASQYGVFAVTVLNSTVGSLSAEYSLLTPNTSGVLNQGLIIGAGIHGPNETDKGIDTSNWLTHWINSVDSITDAGSTWVFNATTNHTIQYLSGTFGVFINNGGLALDISSTSSLTIERLGAAGASLGQLILAGNTSGSGTLTPQAAAGSSPVWTLPNASGTLANSATSPLALNATTGNLTISAIPNSALANPATTIAGQTCTLGSTCGLSSLTNALSGAVSMVTSGVYVVGPTVAQGTTGTWLATGQVMVTPNAAGNLVTCKLWDGTTIIASALNVVASTSGVSIHLAGYLASPAGNLRISCANQSANGGTIAATDGIDGNTASTISAVRIN